MNTFRPFSAELGLLFIVAVCLESCTPVPVIQSARVKSGGGISFTLLSESEHTRIEPRDTVAGESGRMPGAAKERGLTTVPVRNYLKFGIADRVEISVSIFPVPTGRLKLALFDKGDDRLFRNFSTAVFALGTYPSKAFTTITGGMIAGTHCNVSRSDIELVAIVSGTSFHYRYIDDQQPDIDMYYKTAEFSLGCIYTPGKSGFFALTAGATGRLPFGESCSITSATDNRYDIREFSVSPFVVQAGMQLYITREMRQRLFEHR